MKPIQFKYQYFIITLLIMGQLSQKLYGQSCYATTTGTPTARSGNYPSGGASWSGYNQITGNITVTGGTLTINSDAYVLVNAGKKITVASDGILIIQSGVNIYSGGSNVWDGIIVQAGGEVDITDATIQGADIGVKAVNSTSESKIYIDGGYFCSNDIGIYLGPVGSGTTLTSYIRHCTFEASDLPGAASEGSYAIVLNNVQASAPFLIGKDEPYEGSSDANEIFDYNIGIRSIESDIIVRDCYIHDLIGSSPPDALGFSDPTGMNKTGIVSTGSSGTTPSLNVGIYDNPDLMENLLENCKFGVYAYNYVQTEMINNTIISDYDIGTELYVMTTGIWIENNSDYIYLENNIVNNFRDFGIRLQNNDAVDQIVCYFNHLEETGDFNPDLHPVALGISNCSSEDFITFESNTVLAAQNGIYGISTDDINCFYNILNIENHEHDGPEDIANGIFIQNCDDAAIDQNTINGNYTGTTFPEEFAYGIYLENSTSFSVNGNWITNVGYGIYDYLTSVFGTFTCNGFDEYWKYGIYFYEVGDGGTPINTTQGGSGDPSGNHWYPEDQENKLVVDGGMDESDLGGVTWYYDDTPEAYDIPPYDDLILPGALPTYDPETDETDCTAYGEREAGQDIVDLLEADYYNWALDYLNDQFTYDKVTWYKLYKFWNEVFTNMIDTNSLSEPLQGLYNDIAETNIPLYYDFESAIIEQDFERAGSDLAEFNPQFDFETDWQTVAGIYLNSIDSEGVYILNSETLDEVRSYAIQQGATSGPGTYLARVMMDTIIQFMKFQETEKSKVSFDPVIKIAPNPGAGNFTVLISDIGYSLADIRSIDIIDITGNIIHQTSEIFNGQFNISTYQPGVYIINIYMQDGKRFIEKIQLIK